jgi:hypothetical protein
VLAASIIRAMMALMMEAASTYETSVNFCQTTLRNNQKTATFILAPTRILNFTTLQFDS